MLILKRKILCILLFLLAVLSATVAFPQENPIHTNAWKLDKNQKAIQDFYARNEFRAVFAGKSNSRRQKELISILLQAEKHGLPVSKYYIDDLQEALRSARSPDEFSRSEMAAAHILVKFINDLHGGYLVPNKVDKEIALKKRYLPPQIILQAAKEENLPTFVKEIMPQHSDYMKLLSEKKRLEKLVNKSMTRVDLVTLFPGDVSDVVPQIRKRLAELGYGRTGQSKTYDPKLVKLVKKFQEDHALGVDGIVGAASIGAMNMDYKSMLARVLVNLERQRWLGFEREERHIYVNLPAFSVKVFDNGKQSFFSRTVIGALDEERRSPEFVDTLTHMVINPTWHVPSSIAGKEYLPIFANNPTFLNDKNMELLDINGKPIDPSFMDFSIFTQDDFPFFIKQRPDKNNALGEVKFMFPNRFNIYMHDTPQKSLFNLQSRAFSHGCIRVHRPQEFAYKLLERQSDDPELLYEKYRSTGKEHYVNLTQDVQVIITYQTVIFNERNKAVYLNDIYGRDEKIAAQLRDAGLDI